MRPCHLALTTVLCLAPAAHAIEGFNLGLEYGTGSWSADPVLLADELRGGAVDPAGAARVFTEPLDGLWRQSLNFHLGWNVKGYEAIELVMHSSFWSPLDDTQSFGVGHAGLRFTTYPFQYWYPDRMWDVGLELGGGYSVGGGHTPVPGGAFVSAMRGPYVAYGITGEWYPAKWFSLGLQVRHLTGYWATYVFDWNAGATANTPNFTSGFTTIGLAATFHFGVVQ